MGETREGKIRALNAPDAGAVLDGRNALAGKIFMFRWPPSFSLERTDEGVSAWCVVAGDSPMTSSVYRSRQHVAGSVQDESSCRDTSHREYTSKRL